MASNVYAKAAEYYAKGLWSIGQLEALARKGKLTWPQVGSIVGADGTGQEQPTPPDYDSMTKHELYEWAEARGITVYESWTKADIVAAIQAALGQGGEQGEAAE